MKTNPNEPLNCNNGNGYWNDEYNKTHGGIGLTKREYFAAMALQGLVTNPNALLTNSAYRAVEFADALIKELNEVKNEN